MENSTPESIFRPSQRAPPLVPRSPEIAHGAIVLALALGLVDTTQAGIAQLPKCSEQLWSSIGACRFSL